jgi:putative hydrolase
MDTSHWGCFYPAVRLYPVSPATNNPPRGENGAVTNSEVVLALERWAHDPRLSDHGRMALHGAARRLMREDTDLRERAESRTLTELPRVGPFTARVIRELLDGTRAPSPDADSWPAEVRVTYLSLEGSRSHFIALHDARRMIAGQGRPHGDLQMHTTWSDGVASPGAMGREALAMGYRFIAITDHTHGLRIAGGMAPEAMVRQRGAIARAEATTGVRVLAGAEANVSVEGTLDVTTEELRGTEFALAACHSALKKPWDQTARLLAAVTHPLVHTLGHPRGRVFGRRPGLVACWDEVFDAAAQHGTAIEINADPDRQDLDHTIIPMAIDAGCLLTVGTDSHAPEQLAWIDIAVAHMIRAGVPRERVLNFWRTDDLERWLAVKQVRGESSVAL